ncbi:Mitochondrial intermediate peptidase [Ceratocystis pirilliformis]|uniref:Mitochondrial intermediate peptidase n=1 Tax=Ceratocystis pirilliformis TaxID=259994 RepID=A0ABR3ZN24_9PEZI
MFTRSASTGLARCPGLRRANPSSMPASQKNRSLSTVSPASVGPVDVSESGAHDDSLLREVFDTSASTLRLSLASWTRKSVGLFKNRFLTNPQGFLAYSQINIKRAQGIVNKILALNSVESYKGIVRDLDRLSDLLCRVLDLCDFVRVTHPDASIQAAASDAWAMVYHYMNQLNTTRGINEQLTAAMRIPEVMASWSEEEKMVAAILKSDFMKSGIHLPRRQRQRFVDISQKISESGSRFISEARPAVPALSFPSSRLMGLHPRMAADLTINGQLQLPLMSAESAAAMRSVRDSDVRKSIYISSRTASAGTIRNLENMLRQRAELATLAGFESYAHHALKDRMMARTPSEVMKFLSALQQHNVPTIEKEVATLLERKRRLVNDDSAELNAWDKDFCIDSIRSDMHSKAKHDDQLSAYFSVGTVMQGMSRLFTRLYGIRLVPAESEPGETWHPDVRRLDVIDDSGRQLAVLYCDLFYRPGKSPNPAHYTVRCSREMLAQEIADVAQEMGMYGGANSNIDLPSFDTPEQAANDGMASASHDGKVQQLPTIALICDFPKNSSGRNEPAFLTFYQVETLFHEMGHAIHSILARTSFQNVAGTRCATDFAELPSTLMEHFAADPTVLGLFARHWQTDAPLPYEMVVDKIRLMKRFEGLDTEHQLILAMLDQAYHSSAASDPGFESTRIFHELETKYSVGPADPPSTCWQGFFGHLFGYGATYYSYLFDRVLAERVWRKVFDAGENGAAISRENGEWLKENLLKWGGSRDPWHCVADTLQDERLRDGGEEAMAIVGSWGIKDDHVAK